MNLSVAFSTLTCSSFSISFKFCFASLSSSDSLVSSNSTSFNFSVATASSSLTSTPFSWKNKSSWICACNSFFCNLSSAVANDSFLCASSTLVFASASSSLWSARSSSSPLRASIKLRYFSKDGIASFFNIRSKVLNWTPCNKVCCLAFAVSAAKKPCRIRKRFVVSAALLVISLICLCSSAKSLKFFTI